MNLSTTREVFWVVSAIYTPTGSHLTKLLLSSVFTIYHTSHSLSDQDLHVNSSHTFSSSPLSYNIAALASLESANL